MNKTVEESYRDMPERLKKLREKKKLTQKEVADQLGVNRLTIMNHETGCTKVSVEMLQEYQRLYNTSFDYLIDGTERREEQLLIEINENMKQMEKLFETVMKVFNV